MGIAKIYNDFRTWCGQNIPKGKKYPDRNQLKAYLEKSIGPYPIDNRGWKGLKFNIITQENEDDM